MTWFAGLPAILRFLLLMLIVVIAILIVALIIHALPGGGFAWQFHIGYFHWDLGVR